MKYKIGQQIKFKKEFSIEVEGGKKAKIAVGDMAMVVRKVDDKSGEIIYISGEAKGLSQILSIEVDDTVDEDYILKKLMGELS